MEVFIGTIAAFGFDFVPEGWAPCDGQLLSIAQNNALFSLLGTKYGGDGVNSFALPDLRGRTVIGRGMGPGLTPHTQGEMAGVENVTLMSTNLPAHVHGMTASSSDADTKSPMGASLGSLGRESSAIYASGASGSTPVPMASNTTSAGGNQPHNNMQPYLVLNYCISLYGIYPSRS